MSNAQFQQLLLQARAGRITRRRALSLGLLLGLSTSQIETLRSVAPVGAAPTSPWPVTIDPAMAPEPGTFVLLRDGGAPDIDPHSAYDNLASMLFFGLYEMLIQYKYESTDEYAPMLATAWETNEDQSTATFTIAEGATFHDGTPCDAAAVKASFDRFLLMDTGPVNVIKRFVADPSQIKVVDPVTVTFELGQPQPLFLAAMASEYGPLIVNPKMVEENKTDEDPYAHEWFLTNASGTGPYYLVENLPTEQVIMKKYDAYHGGWDGPHFDRIIARIVPEVSTRRQLLESGDADATAMNLTPEIVDVLKGNDQLQVITYPSTAVYYI
ncbi:MAG: ABC transporter substrate-binding protein, partial [Chloroflexota bacterium]